MNQTEHVESLEEMEGGQAPSGYINSIIRASKILELYVTRDSRQLGIAEISKEMGLHKTSVFRIVKTLENQGWLIQDSPNGKYRLSSKPIILASVLLNSVSVDDIIQQEMRALRDLFNEDVVLTGFVDDVAVCLEKVRSENVLHISSRVGRRADLTRGSTGKTLLAYLPQEQIDQIVKARFADEKREGGEKAALLESLAQIRAEGCCTSVSELDDGVCSVTIPLFRQDGSILYSLAIVGEEQRMRQKGTDDMLAALRTAAKRIERGICAYAE